jgi:hypothetical protein
VPVRGVTQYGETTVVSLTPQQTEQYAQAKGIEQFWLAKQLGIIPEGAEFMPEVSYPRFPTQKERWPAIVKSVTGIDWDQLTEQQQKKLNEVLAEKGDVWERLTKKEKQSELMPIIEKGWGYIPPEIPELRALKKEQEKKLKEWGKEFEKTLKESSPDLYKIYKEQGYKAYENAYSEALKALVKYQVPGKKDEYYIQDAIRDGVDDKYLERLFGQEAVREIKGLLPTPAVIPSRFPSDEEYAKLDLYKPLGDYIWDEELQLSVRPTTLSKLIKQGDLRAKWGVATWDEALAKEEYRKLMDKPIDQISKDELSTLISKPFGDLATEVARIKSPELTKYYQDTPWANKLLQGIAQGVGDTMLSVALMPLMGASLLGMAIHKPGEAKESAVEFGTGMVVWGKDTVVNIWKDPAYGIPYAVITLGPMAYGAGKGIVKVGARVVTWAHPKGMPLSLIAKEYSAGRIPVVDLPKADLGAAVGKALKEAATPGGKLSGEVTVGEVTVHYLKTPYEKVVGNSLWHGTQDIGFVDAKGLVKGLKPGIGEQIVAGLRDIEMPAIRKLNLADTSSVPRSIASDLKGILQKYNARIYGSTVEWLHLKDAYRPGDLDIAVRSKYRQAALRDIEKLLQKKNIPYRRITHAFEILTDDKWVKLLDIDTIEHHLRGYPKQYKPQPAKYIDGIYIERLGEQVTRRGYSLIETGAEGRVKDLPRFKLMIETLAKEKPKYKALLDRFTEDVEMAIRMKDSGGEPGIYFSPYAAELFATGDKPGFVLLLTDSSRIKGIPSSVLEKASGSAWYMDQVKKGLYEPSKTWYRAFETEIVASPSTEFKVPPPTAGLIQRILAGKASDLFTYSTRQEKFLPIRVVADKGVFTQLPKASRLYAVKLHALANSLQNFMEAIKHPGRAIQDIVKAKPGPKGVREMEVIDVDVRRGGNIAEIADRLEVEARTKAAKIAKTEAEFERVFQRELDTAYRRENKALLDKYRQQVESEYATRLGRERFEDIYRYHLDRDFRALTRIARFVERMRPIITRARQQVRERPTERPVQQLRERPTERPRERPRLERPRERPRPERPRERPRPERPRERPRPERPRERPRPERPRERPRLERPRERPRPERPTERIPPRIPPRVPPPPPPPGKPPSIGKARATAEKRKEFAGAIAWRQGFGWWAIKRPYRSQVDAAFFKGKPPPNAEIIKGGVRSAYRSIQTLTGLPPERLAIDMGIFDILIGKPHRKPGEPGAIRFKKDIGQKTAGDITIGKRGKITPRVTKGTVAEPLVVPNLGSQKMPTEIAKQIGSYTAKVEPGGRVRLKVRRL